MNGNQLIKMPAGETGMTVTMPAWCLLQGIDSLSDEDKASFATAIVDMIGDSEDANKYALSVLQQRCRECGRRLYANEPCHCSNEE